MTLVVDNTEYDDTAERNLTYTQKMTSTLSAYPHIHTKFDVNNFRVKDYTSQIIPVETYRSQTRYRLLQLSTGII